MKSGTVLSALYLLALFIRKTTILGREITYGPKAINKGTKNSDTIILGDNRGILIYNKEVKR